MEDIFKRRSVRSYTDQPISKEDLHDLLHAGMSAPTANNARPWHFIVVTDRDVLEKLSMDDYTQPARMGQAAIVVCGDTSKDAMGGKLNIIDCSAATENILVEAASKGIGTVWLAVNPIEHREAHIRQLFDLPENIIPYVVIPLGYPKKPLQVQDRFDGAMVHENRW